MALESDNKQQTPPQSTPPDGANQPAGTPGQNPSGNVPDVTNIYPTPTADINQQRGSSHLGVGPDLRQEGGDLPKGVYVIVALMFLGVVTSLFDTSQFSLLYTVALASNLVLGTGLLFKKEWARKIVVILSALIVILLSVTIVLMVGLQQRANQADANYEAAIRQIEEQDLSAAEQKNLEALKNQVDELSEQAGRSFLFSYIRNGLYAILYLAVAIYLARPKVKQAFG